MVRGAISALCLTLWPLAAGAECRLALLLALDVSASVDETEYKLQRDGLAAALNRPLIRRAILEGAPGEVAIAVYEWSGRYHQTIVLDWTMLDSQGAIDGAVATIAQTRRSYSNWPTALGYSLGFLMVIVGRMQLFTENTMTTVLPRLSQAIRRSQPRR